MEVVAFWPVYHTKNAEVPLGNGFEDPEGFRMVTVALLPISGEDSPLDPFERELSLFCFR